MEKKLSERFLEKYCFGKRGGLINTSNAKIYGEICGLESAVEVLNMYDKSSVSSIFDDKLNEYERKYAL